MKTISDYHRIVIDALPLMDVRAPIEYEKGKFESAINQPIMTDEERHLVGVCFKNKGNESATELGHKLVSGDVKNQRINGWAKWAKANPTGLIYCYRGGQRSQIAQQWISEALGYEIPRIEGGFKAFRNYLLKYLEPEHQTYTPIILGGYTGAGKTTVLKQLPNAIDLEAMANHRGSAFGGFMTPQPCQIDFEHALAYGLIRHMHEGHAHMILENEGSRIGRSVISKPLAEFLNSGNMVIVEKSLEERAKAITLEYVNEAQEKHQAIYGVELGFELWKKTIETALDRIVKRLGLERYQNILAIFEDACSEQLRTGGFTAHEAWVELLLSQYYDPMYAYQLDRDQERIVFSGNHLEVLDYFNQLNFETRM